MRTALFASSLLFGSIVIAENRLEITFLGWLWIIGVFLFCIVMDMLDIRSEMDNQGRE